MARQVTRTPTESEASGKIKSIAITAEHGLVFELKGVANRNKGFKIAKNKAHYSGAVSLVLLAHSRDDTIGVRYSTLSTAVFGGSSAGSSRQRTHNAQAVGLGRNPELGGTN